MSGQRSQPPEIDGYLHKRWLGGGGFADVFLYKQMRPTRDVAVKVLLEAPLDAETLDAFDAEANLMARVSTHPYIVAVYDAKTARDGRPYLVMEYYSEPHYGVRAKKGGVGVDDAMRLGVQIASAVEVAHRAGVLHRDIKPANILVNHFNNPGLADFGIAGARHEEGIDAGQGFSIPFTAPEVLADTSPGDECSDVYSLAATLYTILAGRSPFWSTTGDNADHKMMERALHSPVPKMGRNDIPPSLEHLLTQAMSKDPASRPASALAFARTIQSIERELRLGLTPIAVPEDRQETPEPSRSEDRDGTRAGRIRTVSPNPSVSLRPPSPSAVAKPSAPSTVTRYESSATPVRRQDRAAPPDRYAESEPVSPTRARPKAPLPKVSPESIKEPRRSVSKWAVYASAVALVAIVALAGKAILGGTPSPTPAGPTVSGPTTTVATIETPPGPPSPVNVQLVVKGAATDITWVQPEAQPGDQFFVIDQRDDSRLGVATEQHLRITKPNVQCVVVVTHRAGVTSPGGKGCR